MVSRLRIILKGRSSSLLIIRSRLVTPAGAAGIDVTVGAASTFLPVQNVSMAMQKAETPAVGLTTDANGKCSFNSLPVGKYVMTVTVEGYNSQTLNITISKGIVLQQILPRPFILNLVL